MSARIKIFLFFYKMIASDKLILLHLLFEIIFNYECNVYPHIYLIRLPSTDF